MNDKILKKTQDTLGKLIKKPPMTEKLLNKPPFRFLHDVMTSVIKTTGFMKGLYTEDEMNSENVKDKDSKIAFLQKAIDIVGLGSGRAVDARPTKVVAGHEPEKTNEFLQQLAEAINKKPDNDVIVKKVLSGDTTPAPTSAKPASGTGKREKEKEKEKDGSGRRRKERDSGKPPSKDSDKKEDKEDEKEGRKHRKRGESEDRGDNKERDKDKDKDRERRHREKSRTRDSSHDREKSAEPEGKERRKHRDRDKEKSKDKDGEREERHRDREDKHKDDKERRRKHRDKDKDEDNKENEEAMVNGEKEDGEDVPAARIPRPTSAKGSRRHHRTEDEAQHRQDREQDERREREKDKPGTMLNGDGGNDEASPQVAGSKRLARPSSARPAPPRVKKNEPPPEEPQFVGKGSVPNVIIDKGGDDSDDEGFIAKEADTPPPIEPDEPIRNVEAEEGGDHGGLVKKILETKKELEGGSQAQNRNKKTEIERSPVNEAAKRKEREMVQKEIDKLRGSIQTLTRAANPLGKIMDFIQEDLDQMQKELEMWKKEHRENSLSLQREQSITESSIEPLKAQLLEVEHSIGDQLDVIAAVKSNIIRNDDRIDKMLSTVTKS